MARKPKTSGEKLRRHREEQEQFRQRCSEANQRWRLLKPIDAAMFIADLFRTIDDLQRRVEALEARIAAGGGELDKGSKNIVLVNIIFDNVN
jgi:hypothetical protein